MLSLQISSDLGKSPARLQRQESPSVMKSFSLSLSFAMAGDGLCAELPY